jgi:phage/plasmid-associated DNA primase
MESLKQRLEKVIETKYSVYDAMYVFEKDILDRQQIAIHFADTDICPEKPCKSNHAMNYILGICRNDFSDMNLYFKTKCEESHDHEEEPWITLSDWEFRLGLRNNDESNEEDEDMPDLEPESDDEDDDENEQPPKYTRVEYARKKPQDKREKVDVETNTNKDENRKRKVPNNLDADTIPGETDYAKIMLSDQALAHLAWKNIRTNVVIVDEQGNGYVFSELSMLWEPMIAKQIKLYLCNQIKKIIEKDETYTIREKCDISVKVMSSAGINGVFNFFSAMAYDNTFEKRLNAHISTLPIARGLVVDLKTGKTRKRTRADMYTFAIPCEMEDLEDPETIEKMEEFKNKILMPIFGDNVDMVEFIRMLFGYCMTGEKDERALFIFYGERGANGKGTLMEFMELILGQLYDVVPKEIFISSLKAAQGAATPHLSELQGIRLGTYSETEKEELLNAAVLKSLVSEGDLTKSRDLYSKRYKKF